MFDALLCCNRCAESGKGPLEAHTALIDIEVNDDFRVPVVGGRWVGRYIEHRSVRTLIARTYLSAE